MVDENTPKVTLSFDQIAQTVICNIVEDHGQLFAIVTEGRAGPLREPVRIPLERSHLKELKDAPPGSPRYRYWSPIPLPKEIL
jgi:hypothetical protein